MSTRSTRSPDKSLERLNASLAVLLETEEVGKETAASLKKHREQLHRAKHKRD